LRGRRPVQRESLKTFGVLDTKTVLRKTLNYLGRTRRPAATLGPLSAFREMIENPSTNAGALRYGAWPRPSHAIWREDTMRGRRRMGHRQDQLEPAPNRPPGRASISSGSIPPASFQLMESTRDQTALMAAHREKVAGNRTIVRSRRTAACKSSCRPNLSWAESPVACHLRL
jgi:hypothetical protein